MKPKRKGDTIYKLLIVFSITCIYNLYKTKWLESKKTSKTNVDKNKQFTTRIINIHIFIINF